MSCKKTKCLAKLGAVEPLEVFVMTEPPSEPDVVRPGTPRWVKGFAIAGGLLAVLIVVALLAGHGPGRHMHHGLPAPAPASGRPGW
jgi:hypothetical protein